MTKLRAGKPKDFISIPGRCKRFISCPQRLDRLWGQLGLLLFTGALLPTLKRLRRVADHALPSNADFKDSWGCNSLTPHALMTHTGPNLLSPCLSAQAFLTHLSQNIQFPVPYTILRTGRHKHYVSFIILVQRADN